VEEGGACFDAALAQGPTRAVAIERVVDLLHVTHAADRIAEYSQAMRRGERFPPIAVVRVGARFFVADGHKRLRAYRALAPRTVVVEVWPLRRWLTDQYGQWRRKTRQQVVLFWRSLHDPAARPQARRLLWDTVAHWKRLLVSLSTRDSPRQ
jgi:hypothetical protein